MVPTFISEVITISMLGKMWSSVNSSYVKIGSVDRNICFQNGSDIDIRSDYFMHGCKNEKSG